VRCGKYKGTKHKGIICDRCGVKVTHSRVRRKRMGHINLAAPVVHIWFFKAMPSRLGTLLGMKTSDLEKIIYFQDYVVIDPGDTPLNRASCSPRKSTASAREIRRHAASGPDGRRGDPRTARRSTWIATAEELREDLAKTNSKQKIKDLSKRLRSSRPADQRERSRRGWCWR
jgi:DNA-directed RNA polymerase subunit beta'